MRAPQPTMAWARVIGERQLIGRDDRDADAIGAESPLAESRQRLFAGAEDHFVPGSTAGRRQRQQRVQVPICRAAYTQDPHA